MVKFLGIIVITQFSALNAEQIGKQVLVNEHVYITVVCLFPWKNP